MIARREVADGDLRRAGLAVIDEDDRSFGSAVAMDVHFVAAVIEVGINLLRVDEGFDRIGVHIIFRKMNVRNEESVVRLHYRFSEALNGKSTGD
jgi:hypothetical protein